MISLLAQWLQRFMEQGWSTTGAPAPTFVFPNTGISRGPRGPVVDHTDSIPLVQTSSKKCDSLAPQMQTTVLPYYAELL